MKNPFSNASGFFQQIGKSLMLPVAILPVAGILLGVGKSFLIPVSENPDLFPNIIFFLMSEAGSVIFANLSIIFAIGVALGFTENDGAAALSAVVGYLVMTTTIGVMALQVFHLDPDPEKRLIDIVLGIPTIDTGVFGGIIMGGIAAGLFNRFYRMELPSYLAFFAGKRFVPIVTGVAAIITGVVLSCLWPPVKEVIMVFSNWAAYSNPVLAASLYGFVERLLLPLGLHHAWNVPFFFEIGSFIDPETGNVVHGDINRFFMGDPTAGILSGGFLTKMFGLPMAAVAIWRSALPENRDTVGAIMISAALTSFLTGITEPIEFSFMFISPLLYGIHAVLTGTAFAIMNLLGAHLGYTFSQGGLDFILYYARDTKPWLVLIVGPIYGLIYYFTFRGLISLLNIQTPGRSEMKQELGLSGTDLDKSDYSRKIVWALGGRSNITKLDNCITRLRVEVSDPAKVNSKSLKNLGAVGVVERGTAVQAIFGTRVGNIKSDIDDYLKFAGDDAELPAEMATALAGAREAQAPTAQEAPVPEARPEELEKIREFLGGANNIESFKPAAATRLIITLKDKSLINLEEAQKAGFAILSPSQGNSVQVIVGRHPERFKDLKAA
ncbi:MAG: glucose-specific PTS transporter subunit IIBC [Deltaproteobacteria bacterium]|jgi:PTS system glucose-specific IIC component|nr:glucose-specific PTS transporter subunit IIBC [Deltaproteobacteria bacterium]